MQALGLHTGQFMSWAGEAGFYGPEEAEATHIWEKKSYNLQLVLVFA